MVDIKQSKYQRKLYHDCRLSASLIYLALLLATIYSLRIIPMIHKNHLRIWYVLIVISLLLITFLAAKKVSIYQKKWNIYVFCFALFMSLQALVGIICFATGEPIMYISQWNTISASENFGDFFFQILLIITPILSAACLIISAIYGYKQAQIYEELKRQEGEEAK